MKLKKKQIKAVYDYLVSIQQPTTAAQFKKDWSKTTKVKNGLDLARIDEMHKHTGGGTCWYNLNVKTGDITELDKETIKELTEPKQQ